jgi:hypothetical protein
MEFAHVCISQPVLGATTPTMTSFKKATQGPTMSPQNLTLVNSIIEEEMWCFPFNLIQFGLGERKTSERKTQLSTGQSSMRQAWKAWILKSRKIPKSCFEKFKNKKIQHTSTFNCLKSKMIRI